MSLESRCALTTMLLHSAIFVEALELMQLFLMLVLRRVSLLATWGAISNVCVYDLIFLRRLATMNDLP